MEKTHYRKAFDSPYLSSADIVQPTSLTISHVLLEPDKTKKTKDRFNTAYFVEQELRKGEKLKPMVLNATNSKMIKKITGSPFLDDWKNIPVSIYVLDNIKFGRDIVEGLRISPQQQKRRINVVPGTPEWDRAKQSFRDHKNLDMVLKHADMSKENQSRLIDEVNNETV